MLLLSTRPTNLASSLPHSHLHNVPPLPLRRPWSYSLDNPPTTTSLAAAFTPPPTSGNGRIVTPSMNRLDTAMFIRGDYPENSNNHQSNESTLYPVSEHRVVAQSSATGCRISAPISPPAHYPGTARHTLRRNSGARLAPTEPSETTTACSSSSSSGSSSSYPINPDPLAPPAPRWAHPPQYTNKISGRAWSFSQGQERPDVDFDPELFEGAEPDSILEIMKGMEGRIAVKTTPLEYNIMAWLPGFS